MKKLFRSLRQKLPSKSRVSGAVQGVLGDKLPRRFVTEMGFYSAGKPVHEGFVLRRGHAVIFIHGSADTEFGWSAKRGEFNFGDQLLLDFGTEPLYLRYNSGLAVSDNGERLTQLLEDFCARQKALRRLTLVAHSMGGLVVHSAVYHARAQGLAWPKKLKQVFLLGTPHAGAPLAKIAEKGEQILQFIPNPVTLIAASVIGLRSRGLKDLSRGQLGLPAEGKILQPRVKYVFVAGGVQKKKGGIFNKLLGDGMVRGQSALQGQGRHANWLGRAFPWLRKSADIRVVELPGVNHMALRTSPDVYAVLAQNFTA